MGGDEFIIFLNYEGDLEPIIRRIFNSLSGGFYEQFPISVSMGVARTELVGTDYQSLLQSADQALYSVKRTDKGHYRFFDRAMKAMFSVISPIDSSGVSAAASEEKGGSNL